MRPFGCRIYFRPNVKSIGVFDSRFQEGIHLFHEGGGVYHVQSSDGTVRTKHVTLPEDDYSGDPEMNLETTDSSLSYISDFSEEFSINDRSIEEDITIRIAIQSKNLHRRSNSKNSQNTNSIPTKKNPIRIKVKKTWKIILESKIPHTQLRSRVTTFLQKNRLIMRATRTAIETKNQVLYTPVTNSGLLNGIFA